MIKIERFETAAAAVDASGDKISNQYKQEIRDLLEAGNLFGSVVSSDKRVYALVDPQDGGDSYGVELRAFLLQADDNSDYLNLDDTEAGQLHAAGVRPVLA